MQDDDGEERREVSPAMGVSNPLKVLWDIHQADPETPSIYHEAEIMMDARIVGEFSVGPLRYYIADFGTPYPGHPLPQAVGVRCYDVRKHPAYQSPPEGWPVTDSMEDPNVVVAVPAFPVVRELTALMSLFLRRRIWVSRITRDGNRPAKDFGDFRRQVDPILTQPSSVAGLDDWLRVVLSLPNSAYAAIVSAVGVYQAAVVAMEENPESAYVSLVSCIEMLSGHAYRKRDVSSEQWMPSDFGELLTAHVRTKKGRTALEQWLYPREKVRRRFIAFAVDTTPETFWDPDNLDTALDRHFTVGAADLHKVLGRIYDCRSGLLHEGRSFPAHSLDGSMEWAKHGAGDGREWYAQGEAIPSVRWFERLVSSCIRNYIDRLVKQYAERPVNSTSNL